MQILFLHQPTLVMDDAKQRVRVGENFYHVENPVSFLIYVEYLPNNQSADIEIIQGALVLAILYPHKSKVLLPILY